MKPNLPVPTADVSDPVHRLAIDYRPIDDLKPDPRNPRQHSKKQVALAQLARCIKELGSIRRC